MTILLILAALLICTAPLHAGPTPKPAPGAQAQLPFGIPVPGKPDLVYSPYAKGKVVAVAGPVVMGGRTVMRYGFLVLPQRDSAVLHRHFGMFAELI
jgi:hypothetical protein